MASPRELLKVSSVSAACTGADPELFFPLGERDVRAKADAFSYCTRCTVHRACLDVALGDASLVGIWGGTDEHERRRLRGARLRLVQ